MNKRIFTTLLTVALVVVGTVQIAQALVITSGEYRFVVAEAYTQVVDPGDARVAGEAYMGNQWAMARINEMQQKNSFGLYDTIWTAGNNLPEPPTGTTDQYMYAVLGGLTMQVDTKNTVYTAVNTGLGYNIVQPNPLTVGKDYVDSNYPTQQLPQNVYWTDDIGQRNDTGLYADTGSAYLKIFSTATNVFNLDVQYGVGTGGGAFGTFAPNITAGTLLVDAALDPTALFIQDISGESVDGDGDFSLLRSIGTSDTETGINAFFQTLGAGAWDALFDSNSPNFYGADGQLDFTARALIGSPYLPVGTGQTAAAQTAFGWDFLDVGQADTLVVVIPEPSTVLLLGFGLLGLATYGRKKRK